MLRTSICSYYARYRRISKSSYLNLNTRISAADEIDVTRARNCRTFIGIFQICFITYADIPIYLLTHLRISRQEMHRISRIAAIRVIVRADDVSKRAAPRDGVNRISFGFQSQPAPTIDDDRPARLSTKVSSVERSISHSYTTYTGGGGTLGDRGGGWGNANLSSNRAWRTSRLFRIDDVLSALTGRYNKIALRVSVLPS